MPCEQCGAKTNGDVTLCPACEAEGKSAAIFSDQDGKEGKATTKGKLSGFAEGDGEDGEAGKAGKAGDAGEGAGDKGGDGAGDVADGDAGDADGEGGDDVDDYVDDDDADEGADPDGSPGGGDGQDGGQHEVAVEKQKTKIMPFVISLVVIALLGVGMVFYFFLGHIFQVDETGIVADRFEIFTAAMEKGDIDGMIAIWEPEMGFTQDYVPFFGDMPTFIENLKSGAIGEFDIDYTSHGSVIASFIKSASYRLELDSENITIDEYQNEETGVVDYEYAILPITEYMSTVEGDPYSGYLYMIKLDGQWYLTS